MDETILLVAKDTFEFKVMEYYISGGTEMNWAGRVVYPDGETIELYPITVISQITAAREWYEYDNDDNPRYIFVLSKAFPESEIEILDAVDVANRRKIESQEERLSLYINAMSSKKDSTGRQ